MRRLHAKGRKHVTMIAPPPRFTFGGHLRDGLMQAARETGISYEFETSVTLDDSAEDDPPGDRVAHPAGQGARRLCLPRRRRGAGGDGAASPTPAGPSASDADVVTKQMSGIFSQVRPKVDAICEDIALAGQQMGDSFCWRRIKGEKPEALQILQVPEIPF